MGSTLVIADYFKYTAASTTIFTEATDPCSSSPFLCTFMYDGPELFVVCVVVRSIIVGDHDLVLVLHCYGARSTYVRGSEPKCIIYVMGALA